MFVKKKLIALSLLSTVVMLGCQKQSNNTPNKPIPIVVPIPVETKIPPMPNVYLPSQDYSKRALQNKTTSLSKLTN